MEEVHDPTADLRGVVVEKQGELPTQRAGVELAGLLEEIETEVDVPPGPRERGGHTGPDPGLRQ